MFCANCGTKIEEGIKFCPGCGKAVGGVSNEPVVSVVQQQTAVVQPRPMADEKYCSSCGSVIKKIAGICPKCGVKQSVAGKRNTLLLISAIIGSAFAAILIIVGIAAIFNFITNKDSLVPEMSFMSFVPFIFLCIIIPASILTYIAWVKREKSYALIGAILYIICFYGIVPAILNFVAYGQLKEQNKE